MFVRFAEVRKIKVNGKEIGTTAEHPFYAWERGWVPARELKVGDTLLCEDGVWRAVEEVGETGELQTVYNVRVADFHTYFVGEDTSAVWAHNIYDIEALRANLNQNVLLEKIKQLYSTLTSTPHSRLVFKNIASKKLEVLFDPSVPLAGGDASISGSPETAVVGADRVMRDITKAHKDDLLKLLLTTIHEGVHKDDQRGGLDDPSAPGKYGAFLSEVHAYTAEIEFAMKNRLTGYLEGELNVKTIRSVVSAVLTRYSAISEWLQSQGGNSHSIEDEVIQKVHSLIPSVPTGLR